MACFEYIVPFAREVAKLADDSLDLLDALDQMVERAEEREGVDVVNADEFKATVKAAAAGTGFNKFMVTDDGIVTPDFNRLPAVEQFIIVSYYVKKQGTPPNENPEVHLWRGTRPVPPHLQNRRLTPKQLQAEAERLMPGRHAERILAVIPQLKTPAPGTLRGKPIKAPDQLATAAQINSLLQEKFGQKGAAKLVGVTDRSLRGYNEFFKGFKGGRTRAPSEKVYARLVELRGLVDLD
jgi:hypothetical protein